MGAYSQYYASEKDSHYKRAIFEVQVLSRISEFYLPVIDNMTIIHENMLTVRHYLSYKQAIKDNPNMGRFLNWHDDASDSHKLELQTAKESFQKIQMAAAEILKISIEHYGLIPADTLEWANSTLDMKFAGIKEGFDGYAPIGEEPNKSVLKYSESTGKAFGAVIGRIRAASDTLRSK